MQHDVGFVRHLAAVRARFVNRIEEWLPAIEAVQEDLNAAMSTKTDLRDLRGRAHKVAGSAGSFGYPLMGRAAEELERSIDIAVSKTASINSISAVAVKVEKFLAEARDTIAVQRQANLKMANGKAAYDQESAAENKETEPLLDGPTQITRPVHILIVDDDDIYRSFIVGALTQTGWTFDEVIDGKIAIDHLTKLADSPTQKMPDLIVMDVEMPGMDGFTSLGLIKACPKLKDVPVVMLTKNNDIAHMIRGFSKGAHEYLTKPIEISRLSNVVKDLLFRNDRS